MINFLRKSRHQVTGENRVSKYIFYAIGEIFLVVIGILIAVGRIVLRVFSEKSGTGESQEGV